MNDLDKSYKKVKNGIIPLSLFLVGMEIYYYYSAEVKISNIHLKSFVDKLNFLLLKTGIYDSIFYNKILIIVLSLLLLADNNKKIKKKKISKKMVVIHMIISSILFFGINFFIKVMGVSVYSMVTLFSYLYLISFYSKYGTFINMKEDKRNLKNKIFKQMEEKIENERSVNIPYKFVKKYNNKFKEQYAKGWINVVSPERASIIMGKPGSGKSFSFNEEFLRQHIMKAFAMINYDYKFPTLTNVAYNYTRYYQNIYKKKYGLNVNFVVINIDNPEYSHRCNPISNKLITKTSEAVDSVHSIFYNIDKKFIQKPEFFENSAMSLVTAAMWFLRIYKEGKYLSLPHLIEFIQHPDDKIINILCDYGELSNFVSAFRDANEKKAYGQLAGMTASARIPLSKLVTDEMYWVMTEEDNKEQVNLRVNLHNKPTILNIANNPKTQKSNAPALGLYMSQAVKVINAQGRIPCNFHVDELPTIYINGLDNLIATGRSNGICTTLAFQDYTQLVRDYRKEVADAIFDTCGNIFCGQVNPDTAKKIKEMIGKVDYEKINQSVSPEGKLSYSINRQRDYLVEESDLAQFTQGEFVGLTADNFTDRLPIKIFKGMVSPDKSNLEKKNIPIINEIVNKQKLVENRQKIQKDVRNIIENEINRIEEEQLPY